MRLRFYILLFLMLLAQLGYAQLYVSQGGSVHLKSSNTSLQSKASVNIINGTITGKGILVLIGESQQIESQKHIIALPNLKIFNANNVVIGVDLEVANTITINKGILKLAHNLHVNDTEHVVLLDSNILETPTGQIHYNQPKVIPEQLPSMYFNTQNATLFYIVKTTYELKNNVTQISMQINTYLQILDYDTYILVDSPPPKLSC